MELPIRLIDYWRSIILFERNSTTFKFALAKSLLEFAEKEITEITVSELALVGKKLTPKIEDYIKEITNLDCEYWNDQSAKYFTSHYQSFSGNALI